jgi:hypothetical protein
MEVAEERMEVDGLGWAKRIGMVSGWSGAVAFRDGVGARPKADVKRAEPLAADWPAQRGTCARLAILTQS